LLEVTKKSKHQTEELNINNPFEEEASIPNIFVSKKLIQQEDVNKKKINFDEEEEIVPKINNKTPLPDDANKLINELNSLLPLFKSVANKMQVTQEETSENYNIPPKIKKKLLNLIKIEQEAWIYEKMAPTPAQKTAFLKKHLNNQDVIYGNVNNRWISLRGAHYQKTKAILEAVIKANLVSTSSTIEEITIAIIRESYQKQQLTQ